MKELAAETPTKRSLSQTKLSAYPKARRSAGSLLDDDDDKFGAGPIIDLVDDAPGEAPAKEFAKTTEVEPLVERRDSDRTPVNFATQLLDASPDEAVEGVHYMSAGPCASTADDIHRWQLTLGSALHLYTAALRQVMGDTQEISPVGRAAKRKALEAIEKLEARLGGQQIRLNTGPFGVSDIYMELSCQLERFLAAASRSHAEMAEARARSISLLEDIRSKLQLAC